MDDGVFDFAGVGVGRLDAGIDLVFGLDGSTRRSGGGGSRGVFGDLGIGIGNNMVVIEVIQNSRRSVARDCG